jgi:hypothetical protein
VLSVVACDGERELRASAPTPSSGCPNAPAVAGDPDSVRPGGLSGDVDGDDSPDRVRVAVAARARPGCRAFVVVRTADARLIAPIEERDLQIDLGFPVLDSLIGVDDRPGREIVVRIAAGAATEFAGLFTVYDGALERVRLNGPHGSLFPSGGSVAHLEASNCSPDGAVVISSATARGRGYIVERTFYFFEDARLVRDESLTERRRISPDEVASLPEFGAPPFSMCRPLP